MKSLLTRQNVETTLYVFCLIHYKVRTSFSSNYVSYSKPKEDIEPPQYPYTRLLLD